MDNGSPSRYMKLDQSIHITLQNTQFTLLNGNRVSGHGANWLINKKQELRLRKLGLPLCTFNFGYIGGDTPVDDFLPVGLIPAGFDLTVIIDYTVIDHSAQFTLTSDITGLFYDTGCLPAFASGVGIPVIVPAGTAIVEVQAIPNCAGPFPGTASWRLSGTCLFTPTP